MTTRLVVAMVAAALLVGTQTATPSLAVPRAAVVPATPVLAMPLTEGITEKPGLTSSQKAKVTADVRWLQDRLNVLLGRIKWTAGAIRADGQFDGKTTEAVVFFKTWANASRKLLHMTPLFPTIGGVVGQSTVGVVAIVGAYFQLHPPVHYLNPDSIDGLRRIKLTVADLGRLSQDGGPVPPRWYWRTYKTWDSDHNGLDFPCALGTSVPDPWVGESWDFLPISQDEYPRALWGAARTMVYHFDTVEQVDQYMNARRGSVHDVCLRDTSYPEALAEAGFTVTSKPKLATNLPRIGSNSIGYRWTPPSRAT